jgi:hypothetical protein
LFGAENIGNFQFQPNLLPHTARLPILKLKFRGDGFAPQKWRQNWKEHCSKAGVPAVKEKNAREKSAIEKTQISKTWRS